LAAVDTTTEERNNAISELEELKPQNALQTVKVEEVAYTDMVDERNKRLAYARAIGQHAVIF